MPVRTLNSIVFWIKCCRGDYWTLLFYSGVVPLKKSSKYDHVLKISSQEHGSAVEFWFGYTILKKWLCYTPWLSVTRIHRHACDDGPWRAHWAFPVNSCWDAGLCWTNSAGAHEGLERGRDPVTTWLNMVQTSIHRWGFCFFLFLFETFKRLLVSVYTSQLKEHLFDVISTRFGIWHPFKLFTFIELCYVSYFRWACYPHKHMN